MFREKTETLLGHLTHESDMKDTIYKQDAIDAVSALASSMSVCLNKDECVGMKRMQDNAVRTLVSLPSAEPESCDMCDFCNGLESGDKLFQISDWDGGIGFDYIYIKYCPMCGRKL